MTIKDISYFSRGTHSTGNESGRSMVEMLGTIGIITMITIGAIAASGTGMAMWKSNQTHEQVMELIQGITDIYSWNRDGWTTADFSHQALCENGDFSSCEDGNIVFSSGSTVKVEGANEGTTLLITVSDIDYKIAQFLQTKKDASVITNITCVKNCEKGNRGAKTLLFTHDSNLTN